MAREDKKYKLKILPLPCIELTPRLNSFLSLVLYPLSFILMLFSLPTLLLAGLASFTNAALTNTGRTVTVNSIPYYLPGAPLATIPTNTVFGRTGLVPLTVTNSSSLVYTTAQLTNSIAAYTAADDVFQTGFLQGKYRE